MKTAEEILDEQYANGMHWKTVNRANVLIGMEVYAQNFSNQKHKELLSELSKQNAEIEALKKEINSLKNV